MTAANLAANLAILGITPAEWEHIKGMSVIESAPLVWAIVARTLIAETEDHLHAVDRIDAACRDAIDRIRLYRRLGADPHWSVSLSLQVAAEAS